MSELVKQQEQAITPINDSATILQVIERSAADPNVDVGKMERLLAVWEKMDAKQAEMAFNAAMVGAQSKMKAVSADAVNPQTRSKYASYAGLDKALRPVYTDAGFSPSFDTADSPLEQHVRVVCYLSHSNGFSRTYHVDMPADGKGAKGGDVMTKTHAAGAAMSYGMRYLLKMMFNVAVGEDDTDGNTPIQKISQEQAEEIRNKLEDNAIPLTNFLEWLEKVIKCKTIEDINMNALDIVHKRIDSAIRAQNK